jgi:hypothetical protein
MRFWKYNGLLARELHDHASELAFLLHDKEMGRNTKKPCTKNKYKTQYRLQCAGMWLVFSLHVISCGGG